MRFVYFLFFLITGDVIPDPAVDPAANAKKCIECTTEYASRYCTDCDDHYCDDCWTKTHSAGKRALHSFELTGYVFQKLKKIEKM